MPLELGVWRIDQKLEHVQPSRLDFEERLETLLAEDISIASPDWLVIGRQVKTSFDKIIDLLAINSQGNLVILELKRDKTHRDIVAQVLDYGSWARYLKADDMAKIFSEYRTKYFATEDDLSLDAAFCQRFKVQEMPDELNESHELVIVASYLDVSTERVVTYLSEVYGVTINAVFFRVFRDEGREYLTRAWLTEATMTSDAGGNPAKAQTDWNGEYYCSYGGDRSWDEAVKFGFVAAGGGAWYSQTLGMLDQGDRIWVNIPGSGYVGVGIVEEAMVPIEEFLVTGEAGKNVSITDLPIQTSKLTKSTDDPETAEYLVRVKWIKTVPVSEAIKEKGFFGNQNTVARPTSSKWGHTIARLKKRLGVD